MATTLSRNLKLRIDSNLTANSKYNLERLDLLGGTFVVDTTDRLNIRSRTDILIEPESADIDGSGVGGTVSIGTPDHQITSLNLYTQTFNISSNLGLLDQASGGNKYLHLKYKSDINGLVDTVADRNLSIDLDGADRALILGGDFQITGGSLEFTLSGTTNITLPQSGTLSTDSNVETLSNKTISGLNNTLSNISYGSLLLSNSVTNADIASSAGISYSKLSLGNSIVNADISSSAAIAGSKILPTFGNQVVSSSDRIRLIETFNTDLIAAQAGQVGDLVFELPADTGNSGQVLSTDGAGILSWINQSGGGGGGSTYATNWVTGDGTTKSVTHSLGSSNIEVAVVDTSDNSFVGIDEIVIVNNNSISLSASEAPASTWRVIVQS